MVFLSSLFALCAAAPADTLRPLDIEEAVIVAQPKETATLRSQAVSASLFDRESMTRLGVTAVKDLSVAAPGFFIPHYGSRLTSAVYVRGVGSRAGSPAVGMYVDNIPFTDKTAYDFTFSSVDRVDILRGPQGTLYGAGAMGGVVRIYTADPLTHHGTTLNLGWTSRTTGRRLSAETFLHPSERLCIGLNAYYNGSNGYFTNRYNGKKQDGDDVGGGRMRLAWRPSQRVRIDWTTSYEQSREDACPYYWTDTANEGETASGTIEQNRPSSYRRKLFNTGLAAEHRFDRLTLTSTTAYQYLTDRLFMDQDFTSNDIFSLEQRQRLHTVSEEIALKSRKDPQRRWQWTTGAYFQYSAMKTTCPVTFYEGGVDYLNSVIAENLPSSPTIGITFTGEDIPFRASLKTPTLDAALFHQSSIRLFSRLYATLGLRLDYLHQSLDLASGTASGTVPYHFGMAMGQAMRFDTDLEADPTINGRLASDKWIVQPKAALVYKMHDDIGNLYLSVSKGYRPGGYNIQSYSDLSQSALRRAMMLGVRDYSIASINALPYLPDAAKQGAIRGMTSVLDAITPAEPDLHDLYYKPEYTWSYEAGLHHNLLGKTLQIDLAAFYMKTRDKQIARFTGSGMGRTMVNTGRSRSVGMEVSLRSLLFADRLSLSAAYGWTDAKFTDYDAGETDGTSADYSDNRVPFVPTHTLSLTADYRQPLHSDIVRAFTIGADVKAAGSIMWDEANTHSQNFYAVAGAHIGLDLFKCVTLEARAENLTASRYAAFSFESMDRRFAQYAAPRHFSVNLCIRL